MIESRTSEEWQRLRGLYGAMGDEELLGLAAKPEDLTDVAREVLRGEMKVRGLETPHVAPGADEGVDGEVGLPTAADVMPENLGAFGPEIELMIFHDAMAAGRACECLEEAGIAFHVADVSGPREGLGSVEGGPPVALRITVALEEFEGAQGILRKRMGLFPLENVAVPDEPLDDGTRSAVGYFGTLGEAEEIATILARAGFENWVVEGSGDGEVEGRFAVEVREVDLFAAGEAVEKGLA